MTLHTPKSNLIRLCRSATLMALFTVFFGSVSLYADDTMSFNFNISSGDAIVTLKQAAEQADCEIMFLAVNVRGVVTKEVKGKYTVTKAMEIMLEGSGLSVVQDQESRAITIKQIVSDSKRNNTDKSISHNTDQTIYMSKFEVLDDRGVGYQATSTTSATRLNTPIVELSKSIQVITRDLIDDLKVTELNDALYLSSSVSFTGPYSGRVAVRGFESATAKRNGLGNYGSDESISDTVTIDRIEVVKGPSSLLYGSSSPGGVVNYETKRPLSYQQDSIRLIAGTLGKYRAEIDSGGPLIGDGDVLNYRFVAAYDEKKGSGKYNGGRRNVAAGSLRWYITPETYLMVGGEVTKSDRTNIRVAGYPIARAKFDSNGTLIALRDHYDLSKEARDEQVGAFSGPYNRHDSEMIRYDVDFSHKFNDALNVFLHYNYTDNRLDEAYAVAAAEGAIATPYSNPGPNEMNLRGTFRNPHRRSHNGTASISYDIDGGWFETQIIAAWEYFTFNLVQGDNIERQEYWHLVNFVTGEGLLYGWPNTLQGVLEGVSDGTWQIQSRYNRTQKYNAPYLLLHNYFFDRRLRLIMGIRRDDIQIEQTFYDADRSAADPLTLLPPRFSNSEASATTPMIGASYTPLKDQPGFTVFASYSESLVANEIVNPDGSNLPPEKGKGLEAGFKLDLADRFSMTLSWFDIERTNLARGVIGAFPSRWEASGLQRSKGSDMDLFYAVTPNWQLIANAALIDARFVNDNNPALIGTRIASVPKWSWAIWNKYTFSSSALKGLSLGGGVISRASTLVNGATTPGLVAPEYTRLDLLLGYTTRFNGRDVEYSLKINNLFDKVYLEGNRGYGDARSIEGSMTVRF